MNTRDIDALKNELLIIEQSDTISQFVEKCNNNFQTIFEFGGGPAGDTGDKGKQGVPTKPKVPIHVWKENEEYEAEIDQSNGEFIMIDINEDLSKPKYQEGHLILLKTAHVYILEADKNTFKLNPKFLLALQSYNPGDIIDGKDAYVHAAWSNTPNTTDGFVTDQDLRGENVNDDAVATFSLKRTANIDNSNDSNVIDKPYMGIYCDNTRESSRNPSRYTWVHIQGSAGADGLQGEKGDKGDKGDKGEKGDKGDGYTGHLYTIDLEGDMSTIPIDIDRTRLHISTEEDPIGDFCQCIAHAYYGDENVYLNISQITVNLPDEYIYLNDGSIVFKSNNDIKVGKIEKSQNGNDVIIKFIPDDNFIFPQKTLIFPIHIESNIHDNNDGNTYNFVRDTIWMIKGIMSTFKLEIVPQYRTIKLFEDGKYYPEKLLVSVYKVEDGERKPFDLSHNTDFTLLYKNYNSNTWLTYPENGVDTKGVSCLEFKIVKYYGSADEENWDYEDVWVVADGKSAHYYHADLGISESIMILTTGEKINIGTEESPKYCAELRSTHGYSISFEPKFYDNTESLEIESVSIGNNSGEEYYINGTFIRELQNTTEDIDGVIKYKSTLTITSVPYDVDVIPMSINVVAKYPVYNEFGNFIKYDSISDSISFNVYISTLSDTYTLIPTVSSYNTSTGKNGDTIGCDVFKNNTLIPTLELDQNALELKYVVHNETNDNENIINYTEPIIFGDDSDIEENEFTASDVAIEFILYYRSKVIAKSTIPLVKDGIDGKDGDSWQYIFSRSPLYPFEKTGISNPNTWIDNNPNDSNSELLGSNGIADPDWYDDHKGVDSINKYEYQAYRKWDKNNKCWSRYGEPTLYSNYSESGSGYSIMLSNPIAVIPVGDDNDWKVNENNSNQGDSTFVYLYNNTSDMSSNGNVSIELPKNNIYVQNGNFSTTKENGINKVIFKPVVNDSIFDFQSNEQYKLPITLIYKLNEDIDGDNTIDNFTSTINWTLSPIKGLYDVELFVDKRVVNTSISENHTLKVGYYLISTNDSKKFIDNNEENIKGYKIILTDDIENLSSGAISNWQSVEYDFVINGENRNCYVVLVDSDGSTIIDYVNVLSINDGKSSMHLELTQDYIELPCSADGSTIHPNYNVGEHPIHSQMMLYNGDKLIEDYNNIEYTFKVNNEYKSGFYLDGVGGFDVPKDIIVEDTNIECIATYNGTSFQKILYIHLKNTPYELELSKNILSRDINIGEITDTNLIVRVKYWMNGKWEYAADGVVKANTDNGRENLLFGEPVGYKCDRNLLISNSSLKSNNVDTEVRISYYKSESSDDELSYEIIGIINNGKNGTAPSCKSVEILGYSLNENEDIDTGTWVSLKELGSLTTGQPIYILNKYTWSDGTSTKGVTVTLAGTQGVDGKSRVLFYLGSYKDGSLTETEIIGLLNDERCDYYIDENDQAWMRTGVNEEAFGYSSGNDNDPNWKKSTKVGFLQAGAIHADMINTASLVADSTFITDLTANSAFIENLSTSNLEIDAEKITNLNDKISTATNTLKTELSGEYATKKDLVGYVSENVVDGKISEASAGVLEEARKEFASTTLVAEVDDKIASFEAKVANGEATVAITADNFKLTTEGDVTITGDITAKQLTLIDGSGNNADFSAWFVFENVIPKGETESILCPVLHWQNSSGSYMLDMSSVVKKIGERQTQFIESPTRIYTHDQYQYVLDDIGPVFQEWYLNDDGSIDNLVSNKYYTSSTGGFSPISGDFYIKFENIGVISCINDYKLYQHNYGDTEEIEIDTTDQTQCLAFINMGVFGKFTTDTGLIPSIYGENFILAYPGQSINFNNKTFYSEEEEYSQEYLSMNVNFTLPQYSICVPSGNTIDNSTGEGPFFSDMYSKFNNNWRKLVLDCTGDEIGSDQRTEYGYGLEKYVNIDNNSKYTCVVACDKNNPIVHYTYIGIIGGGDSDSDYNSEFNWLKTHEGL